MPDFFRVLLFGQQFRSLRFGLAFFFYLMILALGSIPNARAEVGQFASGVILHSVSYAVITFLLVTGSRRLPGAQAIQAILIVMAMGAVDEFVQSFFPYRTAAVGDWLVDCAAAVSTAGLLYAFNQKWTQVG